MLVGCVEVQMDELSVALSRQSLGRELTVNEEALATALEAQFRTGGHDLGKLVEALNAGQVARPSGEGGAWTEQVLETELRAINLELDAAELARGSVEPPLA